MQPPAEHVHWLFATGFLLLGALPARARRSSATRSGSGAGLARLPLARLLFGLGRPDVAGDGLLHQLDDPHARPRRLGPDDDARRRGRARRSCAGSCTAAPGGCVCRSRSPSPARRSWSTSRTAGSSRAPRSCTTRCGWTLLIGALFPLAARLPAALAVWRAGLALTFVVVSVLALLRPRRRARLRPPLAARRGAAPVRRAARRRALLALALPAAALGARDAGEDARPRSGSGSSARPRSCASTSTRASSRCRTRSGSTTRGAARLRRGRVASADKPLPSTRRVRACRAARTPSAGARSPRRARRLGRLHVRRPRAARRRRPRPSAPPGRRRPSTSSAGSTSSRSRCSPAGSASGCWSCAGRCGRGGERRFYRLHRRRRRRRARGRDRRLPAPRRGRAPAAVRATSSTATSRRSPRHALRRSRSSR